MSDVDYLALARVGVERPDCRPDGTGLDDGPPLPKWHRKGEAQRMRREGATLRAIASQIGVSHECVRDWTRGIALARTTTPETDR